MYLPLIGISQILVSNGSYVLFYMIRLKPSSNVLFFWSRLSHGTQKCAQIHIFLCWHAFEFFFPVLW